MPRPARRLRRRSRRPSGAKRGVANFGILSNGWIYRHERRSGASLLCVRFQQRTWPGVIVGLDEGGGVLTVTITSDRIQNGRTITGTSEIFEVRKMLKSIEISNFKGISATPVELGRFNVLIGANAAGKSNFVDALRFIHDILEDSLRSAVRKRLGWNNVLTRDKAKSEKITTRIKCCGANMGEEVEYEGKIYEPINLEYMYGIGCRRNRLYVNSEELKFNFQSNKKKTTEHFSRTQQKVKILNSVILEKPIGTLEGSKQVQDQLFIETGFFNIGSSILSELISRWQFYELNVGAARGPCNEIGHEALLDDGSNLASILEKLKTKSLKVVYDQIVATMSSLIPGFENWKTARQFDGPLVFKIQEHGISKGFWPKMISDGTIRLLGVLVALLYQPSKASLICIDEPERYLHPQVLESLVEIMRDVSEKTQLIVTTQSPELVKWLKPNEVLMVDKKNNSTHIKRAEDIEMVDKFMEDFTMDELWLGGYLEGGRAL